MNTLNSLLLKVFLALMIFSLSGCCMRYPVWTRHYTSYDKPAEGVIILAQGDELRIVLPSDELFVFDTPELKPSSFPTLNYVVSRLKCYGATPILVTAYTDNVESLPRNRRLSLRQARSVVAYFWVHGIQYQHLYAAGKGAADPVATNATVVGSAANRRVEITLKSGCPNQFQFSDCIPLCP